MTSIAKGGNVALPPQVARVRLVVECVAGPDLDASLLLLAGDGRVRSDADFVFYNQPASPEGTARHLGKTGRQDHLGVELPGLPPAIETVVVAASTDQGTFGQVQGLCLHLVDDGAGAEIVRFDVATATTETAFVLGELYKRAGAWKFRAVGQGWASGLAGLATDYGITVDDPGPAPAAPAAPAPPPVPVPVSAPPPVNTTKAIRLEKQLAGQSPQMINLVKNAGVSLEKRGLQTHRAKVALCLDISPSMYFLYQQGAVQDLCERILALSVQLDDDGQCDVFTFGGLEGHDEGELDLRNYQGWVQGLISKRGLDNGTNYALAMSTVRNHYFPDARGGPRTTPIRAELPVFVMFVTDGATQNPQDAMNQAVWSSGEPIFWQFMAIDHNQTRKSLDPSRRQQIHLNAGRGQRVAIDAMMEQNIAGQIRGEDFGFIAHLTTLPGRFLPNSGFFTVGDPGSVSDEQLYEMVMGAYPAWLAAAKQAGIIPPTA